ncbi:uncharacterized protein LOC123293346 isoform X1 [Chrysoperla carnea]|uniref:uncharacterized protein LOC123293346 isoform X1 n=1 Tax=Chrysoperla carnea TaxID=189513 RepID=UPI001D06396B|nr:uncharacterized protein LOC123293346 isoform X1 [Chrysoperla carnea]
MRSITMLLLIIVLLIHHTVVNTTNTNNNYRMKQQQYFYNNNEHYNNRGNVESQQQLTREIHITQGTLQGVIVEPYPESSLHHNQNDLPKVERYLGIPYAAAPVGGLRFMPPGAPPRWDKTTKVFDTLPPVCPQNLPIISKSQMSRGRYKYMQRLLQFLKRFNQSEDCLYLNIYAPAYVEGDIQEKYPVMVFIHGESFEWNSGNPYDGSVLASYGRVIVITFNFRLGILGFMKPGVAENTPSNFGLLDQIAALQWVQDNIGEFGGDRNLVTLMGHDTGAACVNFLMLSPVSRGGANAEGLFHRAILMSGSALSDWALVKNPAPFTMQVAERLNCNPPDMTSCLRVKRLEDIMSLKITGPRFMTKFGPVVDGAVVPNDPYKIMSGYRDLFKSYDLMFGLTEQESYHLLDAITLHAGILEKDFEATLRAYVAASYEYELSETAYSRIIQEYTDIRNDGVRRIDADHRDILLDILSDARVVAPLITTANLHLAENPKSYFYIFGHNSVFGEYSMLDRSVNGEEIPFVFGIPKGGPKYHYEDNASKDEILLSEQIMRCWTNFAKTGNPNAPRRFEIPPFRSFSHNFDLDWPEYDFMNKSYMNFGIPPVIGYHYRDKFMEFWNVKLPFELEAQLKRKLSDENTEIHHPHQFISHQPSRGITASINPSEVRNRNPSIPLDPPWRYNGGPLDSEIESTTEESSVGVKDDETKNANITMNIIIGLGVLFLIVNILAFTGLYYKRDKLKSRERDLKTQQKIDGNALVNLDTHGNECDNDFNESHGCNVLKMVTSKYDSNDQYDMPIKNNTEANNDESKFSPIFKLKRQYSTSTIDPNTKVRNWITQEIVQKYSPRFLRRNNNLSLANSQKEVKQKKNTQLKGTKDMKQISLDDDISLGQTPTRPVSHIDNNIYDETPEKPTQGSQTDSSSAGNLTLSSKTKPKKVSVAIDATPAARSCSILEQQPIELTKSLTLDSDPSKSGMLRRSATMQDFLDSTSTEDGSSPHASAVESTVIKIEHSHSKSDPIDAPYYKNNPNALYEYSTPQIPLKLQTFTSRNEPEICSPKNEPEIVNVTSRDEIDSKEMMTPAEALMTIKRRNYPKVLPDLPNTNDTAIKRRSLPHPGHLCQFMSRGKEKTNVPPSLAPRNVTKIPPAPPPRTTSTMDRSASVEEKEVKSTLHVGQLLPKKSHKPVHVHVNDHDLKPPDPSLGQPIYDNVPNTRPEPKTIITASGNTKKIPKPKVIIKPTIMKKPTERADGKYIPHVTASNLPLPKTKLNRSNSTETPSKPSLDRSNSTETTSNLPTPKFNRSNSTETPVEEKFEDNNFSKKPDIIVAEYKSRLPKPLFSTKTVSSEKSSNSSSSNSTLDSNSSSDTGTVVKRIC